MYQELFYYYKVHHCGGFSSLKLMGLWHVVCPSVRNCTVVCSRIDYDIAMEVGRQRGDKWSTATCCHHLMHQRVFLLWDGSDYLYAVRNDFALKIG